jgi:hypothetical protein
VRFLTAVTTSIDGRLPLARRRWGDLPLWARQVVDVHWWLRAVVDPDDSIRYVDDGSKWLEENGLLDA